MRPFNIMLSCPVASPYATFEVILRSIIDHHNGVSWFIYTLYTPHTYIIIVMEILINNISNYSISNYVTSASSFTGKIIDFLIYFDWSKCPFTLKLPFTITQEMMLLTIAEIITTGNWFPKISTQTCSYKINIIFWVHFMALTSSVWNFIIHYCLIKPRFKICIRCIKLRTRFELQTYFYSGTVLNELSLIQSII